MSEHGLQQAAALLFREAFEGVAPGNDYTWFVQGPEGILNSLTSVSAETASRRAAPGCSTIAAHAYHLLFTLRNANTLLGRPEPEGTWESSWDKQSATQAEWAELLELIRSEFELYAGFLESNLGWPGEDAHLSALAPLPHVSFHLGAIRQLMKVVG